MIVVSKAAYYAAKFALIRAALLEGDLVATPWRYQLTTFAFILVAGLLVSPWTARDRAPARSSGGVTHV